MIAISYQSAGGSDPLLGSICRACGCSWVARPGTDGCTTYRCECDSTEKANCVTKAPGGFVKATYTTDSF